MKQMTAIAVGKDELLFPIDECKLARRNGNQCGNPPKAKNRIST